MINYEKEIENFKEQISELVKKAYEENRSVDPVLFALVFKDNKLSVAILSGLEKFFISDRGKEAAAILMRKFNEEAKPLAIAFASEGWMSAFEKGEEPVGKDGFYKEGISRPSEDPNRKEVLNITFETHDKQAFVCWEIVNGILKDTDYNQGWSPKHENVKGTFMDLLKENYDHVSNLLKSISLN